MFNPPMPFRALEDAQVLVPIFKQLLKKLQETPNSGDSGDSRDPAGSGPLLSHGMVKRLKSLKPECEGEELP
jgi:hypothetical protein